MQPTGNDLIINARDRESTRKRNTHTSHNMTLAYLIINDNLDVAVGRCFPAGPLKSFDFDWHYPATSDILIGGKRHNPEHLKFLFATPQVSNQRMMMPETTHFSVRNTSGSVKCIVSGIMMLNSIQLTFLHSTKKRSLPVFFLNSEAQNQHHTLPTPPPGAVHVSFRTHFCKFRGSKAPPS